MYQGRARVIHWQCLVQLTVLFEKRTHILKGFRQQQWQRLEKVSTNKAPMHLNLVKVWLNTNFSDKTWLMICLLSESNVSSAPEPLAWQGSVPWCGSDPGRSDPSQHNICTSNWSIGCELRGGLATSDWSMQDLRVLSLVNGPCCQWWESAKANIPSVVHFILDAKLKDWEMQYN